MLVLGSGQFECFFFHPNFSLTWIEHSVHGPAVHDLLDSGSIEGLSRLIVSLIVILGIDVLTYDDSHSFSD